MTTQIDNDITCYRIMRSYHPRLNRRSRTIRNGLTLNEAQAHCSRPGTRKEGQYFDGYDLMGGVKGKIV